MADYVYKIRMRNVTATLPISNAKPSTNTTTLLAHANESQFCECVAVSTYFELQGPKRED
jgi:hypothetical protein